MIPTLLISLITDLLLVLRDHRDFFQQPEAKRRELMKKAGASEALADYGSKLSEEQCLKDLRSALEVLRSSSPSKAAKQSGFSFTLSKYFTQEFSAVFDALDREFILKSVPEQREVLKKLLPQDTRFSSALRQLLLSKSPQEVHEEITIFLSQLGGGQRIVVQSVIECSNSVKKEVREHFAKKYPSSFVLFSVNAQLIGGLRVFVNGNVEDHSWFSKVLALQSLSSSY